MIEVRPFAGTPDELAAFTVNTWKTTYAGSIAVPNWRADYFRWQHLLDEQTNHENLTAAYDGGKLVGILGFLPRTFEIDGTVATGAQAGWLSVHPDHRRQGIGRKLKEVSMTSAREREIRFHVGFVFRGSRKSIGPRFWMKSRRTPARSGSTLGPGVGFWARVLNAEKLATWSVKKTDCILAGISGPFLPTPRRKNLEGTTIRTYQPTDAAECAEVANRASDNCELRLVWDADSINRHLTGFGRCLVAQQDNSVRGLIAFHTLVFSGQRDEIVGIIDLVCVSGLESSVAQSLLNHVLCELHEAGAVVALKLRAGDYPGSLFFRWGWWPTAPHSDVLISWTDSPIPSPALQRVHILWR